MIAELLVMPPRMAAWSGELYGQPGTRCLQYLWGAFLPFPLNGNAQFYLQTTSIPKHKCFKPPEAKYRLQFQAEGGKLQVFSMSNTLHLPKDVEFILPY